MYVCYGSHHYCTNYTCPLSKICGRYNKQTQTDTNIYEWIYPKIYGTRIECEFYIPLTNNFYGV
jgi:hypothetical protein